MARLFSGQENGRVCFSGQKIFDTNNFMRRNQFSISYCFFIFFNKFNALSMCFLIIFRHGRFKRHKEARSVRAVLRSAGFEACEVLGCLDVF